MISRRTLLFAAASAACTIGSARAQPPGVLPNETLEVDGRQRRYRLVAPPSARPGAPLLIALHGMGIDSISLMPLYSGLDDLARETGSILVYPASFRDHWPLSFGPELQGELRFLDALRAHMARTRAIDPRQVFLLGMSNDGYFATVVASRRSRYLAGLAVHSGSAGVLGAGFETERKFPVHIAHGAADPIFNVRDGRWLSGMFTRMGHPTQYEEVPGLGHIWARDHGVNGRIWSHWRTHRA
jgi:polyhydroxybutyrate depolymerase